MNRLNSVLDLPAWSQNRDLYDGYHPHTREGNVMEIGAGPVSLVSGQGSFQTAKETLGVVLVDSIA